MAHGLVSMVCGMTHVYLCRPVVAGIDICNGVCMYPYECMAVCGCVPWCIILIVIAECW